MRSGCRAAGIVGSVFSLASCFAAPPATPTTATPSPSSDEAVSGRRVRVEVSAAGVAVDGGRVDSDQAALKAALVQAGSVVIDVQATSDAPAALVLAALTVDAGPHVARRLLSWQDVRVEVSEHHSATSEFGQPIPASIFSWHANRATQLWSVSAGPAVTNFGPFEPGDPRAEPAVIASLNKACAPSGCRIVVELRDERLLDALRAWQRIVAAVDPRLGLQVISSPPPPRSPNRQDLGHLPPEVIQSVVRIGFDRFKTCYEGGLDRDPKLEGRVSVRFVIERDGTVKNSSDGGSDIPDAAVRDCVVHEFVGFKFPAPETGVVTVVYPVMLSPG